MMKPHKIKKYIQTGLSCFVLLSIFCSSPVQAGNDVEKKRVSSITLDWEEFRSLLRLDADEVKLSWDEFNRLMSQTGWQVKPEYEVEGGDVILTRKQFQKILDQMQPPRKAELAPPCEYLLIRGSYTGRMGKESTQFDAFLDLEIFRKEKRAYSKIPLFREELAIEDIRFDEKPAAIITEGGWHYLNTDKTGRYSVRVKFSVKSTLDKGTPGLSFNIPQTPITHITLDIPKVGIDVTISSAPAVEITEKKGHTIVTGDCVPTAQMSVAWRKKHVERARGPAKIYAELFHLLSIEADAIRVTTKLNLNIVQNKINAITLAIPAGYQVLEVTGQGKSIWSVQEEKGKEFLNIPFEYPREGYHNLTIKSEKLLPKETMVADFTGFEVLEAQRESGFVAGEVKSDAEAHVQEFRGADRVDFQKIPVSLTELSSRPILFAFKYIRHPYQVVVDITKHEKEEVLSAIIDQARGTTLFQAEGKLIHQFTFSMRNLWNQFLKLELPQDSSIWSVYVDGKREKASQDKEGKILIPLARSQREGQENRLRPFEVELIYTQPAEKFAILGKKQQHFPMPNVLINTLEWNLYVPANYKYLHWGGNLKREKIPTFRKPIIRQLKDMLPSLSMSGRAPKAIRYDEMDVYCDGDDGEEEMPEEGEIYDEEIEVARKQAAIEPQAVYPVQAAPDDPVGQAEQQAVSQGLAGLLSVRVNIPVSGKNYRFSKKIVEKNEPLHLSFTYLDERIIQA
ncbi:hypothetical protein KAR34_05685, partial [bacterium]|nr:hypothetical protein [bacterium]